MTPERIYDQHNPTVRPLVQGARELVLSVWPDVIEQMDEKDRMFHYGTGLRMSDLVMYVAGFTSHANLGFIQGTQLPDPHGLLEGTGKNFRHVKLRTTDDLNRPGLRELVQAAADLATR